MVQRPNAITHSYTVHINMRADGTLIDKLPIVLYEPTGSPQKFQDEVAPFRNIQNILDSFWLDGFKYSYSMDEIFFPPIKNNIIDSWKGYKKC